MFGILKVLGDVHPPNTFKIPVSFTGFPVEPDFIMVHTHDERIAEPLPTNMFLPIQDIPNNTIRLAIAESHPLF